MSLINQMLRDLDARRPEFGVDSRLPSEVRPLPKAPRSSLRLASYALVVALCVGAIARFVVFADAIAVAPVSAPPDRPASPITAAPLAEASPAASAPPLEALPSASAPLAGVQAPAPGETTVTASAAPELGQSLRLTESLASFGEPRGRAKAEPPSAAKKAQAPLEKASIALVASATLDAQAGKKPAAVAETKSEEKARELPPRSAHPPKIEKTAALGAPAERAENAYRQAIVVLNEGRVSEALDALRAVLKLDSRHSGARQLLAKLLLESGRADEAIESLREGLAAQPAQIGWAMTAARLQIDRRDLNGAWKSLETSLPAASGNAEYQGFAAHVLQRLGRAHEAAECYERAARLAPGDGRWWLGLGLALEAGGRSAEAREAFLRAQASGTLVGELAALAEQKLR